MKDDLMLGAYWTDRKEAGQECAARAFECLRRLASSDAAFQDWYSGGLSEAEMSSHRFVPSLESCEKLFEKGRNRRDSDKTVIEKLGYTMWLWNGWKDAISIKFSCGAYPSVAQLPSPNSCLLEFPQNRLDSRRLLSESRLREIMSIIVESWQPDWGRVSTFAVREAVYPRQYFGPGVGWLTYFSDRLGPIPALPDTFGVTRIGDKGSLITVKGIDRLTASNPSHVEAIRRLVAELAVVGLLSP